ncbi:MAG: [FeFe] hydrogenase H-cluster radical SAM maturase HydE [Calditrichia bacterium]
MIEKLDEILNKEELSREEMIFLLDLEEKDHLKKLFRRADEVRRQYCGEVVYLRGIIEFSNYCRRNCNYCGLRHGNLQLERYRLTPDQIVENAHKLAELGIGTIVLQSGEDPHYTAEIIEDIIRRIKAAADVAITLAVGERPREEYELWFNAGAERYLLKHETINPDLYRQLHPDMEYEERLRCLWDLREIGFQVGTGNMIGLPGQTTADIADDILFMKKIDADMGGIGPYIPNDNTPLKGAKGGTVMDTLKALAVARLVLKETHLPATTALGSIDSWGREKGLQCGANVLMPNFTPSFYRKMYEIYPDKLCVDDTPDHCFNCIQARIKAIGREVGLSKGHSLKKRFREQSAG